MIAQKIQDHFLLKLRPVFGLFYEIYVKTLQPNNLKLKTKIKNFYNRE